MHDSRAVTAIQALLAVAWAAFSALAHAAAYVEIPDSFIRYPAEGKIILVGITLEVKNPKLQGLVEGRRLQISREMGMVAKQFPYDTVAVPANRQAFSQALEKAIGAALGTTDLAVLYNKLEIYNMPKPTVQWRSLVNNAEQWSYMDPGSITRGANSVAKVWLLTDSVQPETFNGKSYASTLYFYAIDCVRFNNRRLTVTAFERVHAQGNKVLEIDLPMDWSAIEKGSILAELHRQVCQ